MFAVDIQLDDCAVKLARIEQSGWPHDTRKTSSKTREEMVNKS
jgi:hypothetical protein